MTTPDDILSRVNVRDHAKRLTDALVPRYIDLLELAWNENAERLGVQGAFDLKNENVQKTVKDLGKRITGISETTRDEIRTALDQIFAGDKVPGTDEIARRLREIGELDPGPNATPREKRRAARRAQTISRTETQVAFNQGALTTYEEAGVRVEILDSDNDEECAARNGKIVSVDEARDIVDSAHPNCQIAVVPVVE